MSATRQSAARDDGEREQAIEALCNQVNSAGIELIRISWCDVHGFLRGKAIVASELKSALHKGISMVSTLLLKDSSDRTAFKVFEPGGLGGLDGFGQANNLMLVADPASFKTLPWASDIGWLRAQPFLPNGTVVPLDTRQVLQQAITRLAQAGYAMRCGLEIEFHIYRITDKAPQLDPARALWPAEPPAVDMIHPGYMLLGENWLDMADEPLRIVQRTAQALDLPLTSLELEFGPSQVEAVFAATDALQAADNMVQFRNMVKMALQRAGYYASFVCRPPFANIMASGWHLHQSLVEKATGANVFQRPQPAPETTERDAAYTLSETGEHYLAGLLAHARGMTVLSTPTINGYGRFRPNALAPQSVLWGRDNRGAMLRVIGEPGDQATRIENRTGEPAANPYLYLASQIYAGLDGIARKLKAPLATVSPYASNAERLPADLGEALDAFQADAELSKAFGERFVDYYQHIKRQELARYQEAPDKDAFERREYFSRL